MCLAVPAKILRLEGDSDAVVDLGSARSTVNVALIENPQPDDWVIIHNGYALSRIDESAAESLAAELNPLLVEEMAEEGAL